MKATKTESRPLGTAGFILSSMGLLISIFTFCYCQSSFQTEIKPGALEGNILPPGSVQAIYFLFIFIVELIGLTIGVVLSLVGSALSAFDAARPRCTLAHLGIVIGGITPLALILYVTGLLS